MHFPVKKSATICRIRFIRVSFTFRTAVSRTAAYPVFKQNNLIFAGIFISSQKLCPMKKIFLLLLLPAASISLTAQQHIIKRNMPLDSIRTVISERIAASRPAYNADSVRAEIESAPSFSLYKDNYFTGGITLGSKITAANSNVKFQLSVSQKLTRSRLPFDTYLFIQFTQKTIWNMLEESMPMHDMNFNPGFGIGHLAIRRNRHVGNLFMMLEHESNGKDGEASRSWNKVSFGGQFFISRNMDIQLKAWVPIVDSENNRDITQYNGLAQAALNYRATDKRFNASFVAAWRNRSFGFNTQWEVSYKINNNENQYMFLQYYNGYGENLLDYNRYRSILRFGFVIKPQGFSIF
jgi:phospholipase A1